MHILTKIKNFNYRRRDKKRYKKFKNCSIPYPFYDNKRNTFEWVTYHKATDQYDVYKKNLLKEFKEESKVYNEDFTEESFIKYVKLKVIKKL